MNDQKLKRKEQSTIESTAMPKKSVPRNRFILPILVLITFLALTYIAWNFAIQENEKDLQSYFDYRVRDVNTRILQRLDNYEQVLRGSRGLFIASGNVTRNEFNSYFNSLHIDENYSGIQGVGYSLIVSPQQLKQHIASIRKEGFPGYTLWPEGERETYTSIIYLEPFKDRNLRAFGYDMFSEPVRRKAMETSRDSNKAIVSGKVLLVQETGEDVQAGFLIYLPFYKNGTPIKTISERRNNIIGWVYSPFRMDDFMEGLLGERANDLDVEIYDGKIVSNETKLFDSKLLSAPIQSLLVSETLKDIDGHEWTIIVKSTKELESRIDDNSAVIILIVGITISLLLAFLAWLIENKRNLKKIAEAERKQAEEVLRASELKYRGLYDSIRDAILVANNDRKIFECNQAFSDLFGYSLSEIKNKETITVYENEEQFNELGQALKSHSGNANPFLYTVNYKKKSGVVFPGETSVYYLNDSVGNIKGFIGLIRDITERKLMEKEKEVLTYNLNERVKELTCLYSIASIIEKSDASEDGMLNKIVETIPSGFQYSEILCARISIEDTEYKTINFKETKWKQSSEIKINDEKSGSIEVFYLEEKAEIDEGPFLKEEKILLDNIAERLGQVIERTRAEEELRKRSEENERFYKTAVGREFRIIELKQKINDLSVQVKIKPPYNLSFLNDKNKTAESDKAE